MEPPTIRWRLTKGDAITRLKAYRAGPFYVVPGMAAIFFAAAVGNLLRGEPGWPVWLIEASIPASAWYYWVFRRAMKNIGMETTVSLQTNGIQLDEGASHLLVDWVGVTGIRARSGVVEILQDRHVLLWIPRRLFPDIRDLKTFMDEVRLRARSARSSRVQESPAG